MNTYLLQELISNKEKAFPVTEETRNKCNIRGPVNKWDIKGRLSIGSYSSINGAFKSRGETHIGKYCAFGDGISLISGNHKTNMVNQQVWLQDRLGFSSCHESKGPICIGHNVWVGDKVTVLSGISVGHGAVIGSGAVVTKDVEPFSIVVGNPAKPIRQRFHPNVVNQMLEIAWWNWPFERMQRNQKFFELEIGSDEEVDLYKHIVE